MGNRLGDHAVVRGGDDVALLPCTVEAERGTATGQVVEEGREIEHVEAAGGWEEAARGVFGAQTGFDSVAFEFNVGLGGELAAVCDIQLQFDEVEAGDEFGDGVFDLETGVHLHEPETVGPEDTGAVDDEFDRAGVAVPDGLGGHEGGVGHRLADGEAHARRGGFLDHFLTAALHRTVAFEQVDVGVVAVAEDLHFDVARAFDEFLHKHAVVAEAGLGFALGAGEGGVKAFRGIDATHAAATAAGDGLDENGIADLLCGGLERFHALVFTMIAGRDGNAVLFHQRLGGVLEAHRADGGWRRTNPGEAGLADSFGEGCVLRQEAVAGVDAFSACVERGFDDAVALEIAFSGRGGADPDGLVGFADEGGFRVSIRIDRDRPQTELSGGSHDAPGDLAAIGDQDRRKHGRKLECAAQRRKRFHSRRSRQIGGLRGLCDLADKTDGKNRKQEDGQRQRCKHHQHGRAP